MHSKEISIWFFIGVLLLIYGLLILLANFISPGETVLQEYHPALWWGLFLLGLGGFYTWRFAPKRG
jgi:FtsH-binding integral membrane protein